MPNCFYIVSDYSAREIAEAINRNIHGEYREVSTGPFIVIEISQNYFGWLLDESWILIHNKEHQKP